MFCEAMEHGVDEEEFIRPGYPPWLNSARSVPTTLSLFSTLGRGMLFIVQELTQ